MSIFRKKTIYPELDRGMARKVTSTYSASINRPIYIIVHHVGGTDANPKLDTSNTTFESVNLYHKKKWNFKSSLGYYIGYHYYIDRAGIIMRGRADTDEGAHTIGKNNESIGICLAGNFDVTLPTEAQKASLTKLMSLKMNEYKIPLNNVTNHRSWATKSCPGYLLADSWVQDILSGDIKYRLLKIGEELIELSKLIK